MLKQSLLKVILGLVFEPHEHDPGSMASYIGRRGQDVTSLAARRKSVNTMALAHSGTPGGRAGHEVTLDNAAGTADLHRLKARLEDSDRLKHSILDQGHLPGLFNSLEEDGTTKEPASEAKASSIIVFVKAANTAIQLIPNTC